jgi:hypothetical protein
MKTESTQINQTDHITTEPHSPGTPEPTPIPPIIPMPPILPISASAPTPDPVPEPEPATETNAEPNTDPQDPQPDAPRVSRASNQNSKIKNQKSKRLRRSFRPTGTPRARCSRVPSAASNPKSKMKNHKSEPFAPLPEFAGLAPDKLEAIHDYIRHHTYEESIAFLHKELGVEISLNRLYRYRSRLDLATQLEIAHDNAPAIENLLALLAGKPVDIDAAGLQIIKQRALALASRPDAAASTLMNIFRVFTWEHRKTVTEHRMRSQDRRDKCRERIAKVAERRQNLAEKKFKKAVEKEENEYYNDEENTKAMIELFGELPPVRPLDAPPKPVDI